MATLSWNGSDAVVLLFLQSEFMGTWVERPSLFIAVLPVGRILALSRFAMALIMSSLCKILTLFAKICEFPIAKIHHFQGISADFLKNCVNSVVIA